MDPCTCETGCASERRAHEDALFLKNAAQRPFQVCSPWLPVCVSVHLGWCCVCALMSTTQEIKSHLLCSHFSFGGNVVSNSELINQCFIYQLINGETRTPKERMPWSSPSVQPHGILLQITKQLTRLKIFPAEGLFFTFPIPNAP